MRIPGPVRSRSTVFAVLLTGTLSIAVFDACAATIAPVAGADHKKAAAGKTTKSTAAVKRPPVTTAKGTPARKPGASQSKAPVAYHARTDVRNQIRQPQQQAKGSPVKLQPVTLAKSQPKTAVRRSYAASRYRAPVRRPVVRVPAYSLEEREAALAWINENMAPKAETFENVRALVPFFEQLYQSEQNKTAVHILHYGDSHSASDDFPNTLRETFQARFGNGGPGFSLAGHPFAGYRRYDVPSFASTRSWITEGVLTRRGDPMQGLGGISMNSNRPGETVQMTAAGDESELLFLQQPDGGSVEVWVDDNLLGTVSTQGELRPATAPLIETPGEHRYMFKTVTSNPVRLFGTVVQNKSGVTWESMGINGAQATMLADWDENILEAHLAKRNPALIVLAYGTNEANNPRFDPKDYVATLRKVLSRLRKGAPLASILLIGPPDCHVPKQNLDAVIDAQIKVAHEMGAAFWSWRDHMGGEDSIGKWVEVGLAQGDHIHMTTNGYQMVGHALAEELLIQYQRFVNARMETE
ncbi:MAG TPA: GDSL-type esterase/lipase family protein [Bryobacteraceae bacterium]